MTNILELKNIEKYYETKSERLHIIKGLNLNLERGAFISILGRSGSGKSTLLNLIGLLDKQDSGEIIIDGKNTKGLNDNEISDLKIKLWVLSFNFIIF